MKKITRQHLIIFILTGALPLIIKNVNLLISMAFAMLLGKICTKVFLKTDINLSLILGIFLTLHLLFVSLLFCFNPVVF